MYDIQEVTRSNIRYFRRAKKMSQMALGIETGLDASHIGKIERGLINPTLNTLQVIAEALETSVEDLISPSTQDSDTVMNMQKQQKLFNLLPEETKEKAYGLINSILVLAQGDYSVDEFQKIVDQFSFVKYQLKVQNHKYKKTYGIKALQLDGDQWVEVARVRDISTNRNAIAELIRKMNYNRASLVHFQEIISDFYDDSVHLP